MNITFHEKNARINERQQGSYTEKIERLVKKLGSLWSDEAGEVKVNVVQTDTKAQDERFTVEVVIQVPGHKLVASETDGSPDTALDSCVEKLKKQIEKTRTKENI